MFKENGIRKKVHLTQDLGIMNKLILVIWLLSFPLIESIVNYVYVKRKLLTNSSYKEDSKSFGGQAFFNMLLYVLISVIILFG